MAQSARVLLSALADEAAFHLTAVEQFTALAALGLEYYSLRFIDVGKGVKNVMKLTLPEIQKLRHLEDEYGLNVASIASPIGKVKLVDKPDGTKNAYVPFKQYLAKDVARACELAHAFETKLIRGFSFYPPKGAKPEDHLEEAVDRIGTDRRGLPPLRPHVRPGGGGQSRGPDGPAARRDPPPREPPRPRARVRRRQPHRAGLFDRRGLRSSGRR